MPPVADPLAAGRVGPIGTAPGPGGADPDGALIDRARGGDPAAFDALVLRHQDRVYAVCLRMCGHAESARDAAQDAFVKAWKALPRFEGRAQFGTWVYRIAINVSLSMRRADKVRPDRRAVGIDATPGEGDGAEGGRVAEPASTGPAPGHAIERDEARAAVAAAIADLEDEFRSAVVLRDIDGRSYEEIAEILQVPVGTGRSRIHRGRETLRRTLERFVAGARPGQVARPDPAATPGDTGTSAQAARRRE